MKRYIKSYSTSKSTDTRTVDDLVPGVAYTQEEFLNILNNTIKEIESEVNDDEDSNN